MYDDEREQAAEGRHHAEDEAASQRAQERVQRGVALLDACPAAHGWRARVYRNLADLDVAIPHQCVLAYALGGPDRPKTDSHEDALLALGISPRDPVAAAHAGFDAYEACRTHHDAQAYYRDEQGCDNWSVAWSHAIRDEYDRLTVLWEREVLSAVHRPTRKDIPR